jgi:hypothetical protein
VSSSLGQLGRIWSKFRMQSSRWSNEGVQIRKGGSIFSIERMMCLEFWVKKSTGRLTNCWRIDDGGGFTSLEFENYYKEVGIEGTCSIMPSCSKSGGKK